MAVGFADIEFEDVLPLQNSGFLTEVIGRHDSVQFQVQLRNIVGWVGEEKFVERSTDSEPSQTAKQREADHDHGK